MKRFLLGLVFALTVVCVGAVLAPVAPADDTAAVLAVKVAVVAVLALNVLPMCSHAQRLVNTVVVANTIQPKYSKKLLDRAVQMVRLMDYAQKQAIEPGTGATSVRFFRPPQADLTAVGAPAVLVEGTPPVAERDISFTPIDVSLVQIGQRGRITDVANTVGLVKYLDAMIDLFGDEFALDADTRVRDILAHPVTGLTKRYGQGLANFAALAAATAENGRIVPRDLLDAMTQLKINRAPKINGHYVAIMPPQGTRDILNNAEFREVVRSNYADKIFKGEVAEFYGLKIVEATNPFQEDEVEGTYEAVFNAGGANTTGFIYSTIVTGQGAYGVVDMAKLGGVAKKPQIVIVDKPDSGNPLGQFITVGWKAFWAGVLLNANWGITLRHKSQFV
jgi:N4-gp56 family major capsid protein